MFISAGEVSGDQIAASVVGELCRRRPDLRFYGAGGPAMARVGVEIRHPIEGLAVTGLTEATRALGAVSRLLADTWREIARRRPAIGILVDYPGANLRLAAMLKRRGIPVLYYVAPQRWAWLPNRASRLSRVIDCLAVTLPFEEAWFRNRGVRAEYVGHPSIERGSARISACAVARRIGLDRRPVLAILPGSRRGEVDRHLPLLRRAAAWLPEVQGVVGVLPGAHTERCASLAPELPRLGAQEVFAVADVALCCSGTATLEAALANVPTAVFYRLSPLSATLARRLLTVRQVALPNILLDAQVMPELLQREMTPQGLAAVVRRLLDPAERARQRARTVVLAKMLDTGTRASLRVADLAQELWQGP
jgi:lipid-A-disaccharide synthase